MTGKLKHTIASVIWDNEPSELHEAQGATIKQLGHRHYYLRFNEEIRPETNMLLVQGPYGTLLPLAQQLHSWPSQTRPVFVYWFQQSMQFLKIGWVNRLFSRIFSDLSLHHKEAGYLGQLIEMVAPQLLNNKGARLGYLGDILWLQERKLLDLLILSSTFYAEYLKKLGVSSIVVSRGYHPIYGTNLNSERDIAAVWMGKIRTRRRAKKLYWLKKELEKRNLTMHIYDGDRSDFIFGNERTEILNRTRFVLNIYFSGPSDELSIRFFVAGANGAIVLTEPGANKYPFLPGKHLLECPVDKMPETILHYLNNLSEWRAISENMSHLIKEELTLKKSIITILNEAEQRFPKQMGS